MMQWLAILKQQQHDDPRYDHVSLEAIKATSSDEAMRVLRGKLVNGDIRDVGVLNSVTLVRVVHEVDLPQIIVERENILETLRQEELEKEEKEHLRRLLAKYPQVK